MKIIEVEIDNFLSIGEANFSLDDQGLILLSGVNKDDSAAHSNGSGKSSIGDAISFCLYGITARGSSGDALIREGTKECVVGVILGDENTNEFWRVNRRRKKGKTSLSVFTYNKSTGIADDITLGTEKLTQELIVKIIGSTEDVFRASVYMGQEQLIDLPRMTDRNLKNIVEEAAGIVLLEQAYEIARDKMNTAKIDVEDASEQAKKNERAVEVKQALLEREEKLIEEWDENQRNLASLLEKQKNNAISALAHCEQELDEGLEGKLAAQIDDLRAQMASYEPSRRLEGDLADQANGARASEFLHSNKVRELAATITKLNAERKNISSVIGNPCPECGTIMTEDHVHSAKEQTVRKLSLAASQLTAERDEHAKAVKVVADAKEALETHRSSMSDMPTVMNALLSEERALGVEQGKRKAIALQQAELDGLCARIGEERKKPNPHIGPVGVLRNQVESLQASVDASLAVVEDKRKHLDFHAQVVEVFGPAGVRAHILDTVTPYLNARTSEYLSMLSDGAIQAIWNTLVRNAKGELREKFSIEVTHEKGNRGFNELSGGERRKVRLSCALALQDLVASRASKPIKLAIMDEVDDALDDAGLERLATVLQAKADVTGTVLVISHNDLKTHIGNVWTMVKENGSSALVAE